MRASTLVNSRAPSPVFRCTACYQCVLDRHAHLEHEHVILSAIAKNNAGAIDVLFDEVRN